jgi:hypothetical protein
MVDGKTINVAEGHIPLKPLRTEVCDKKDWSKAIFCSPSIYYASHTVYSKEMT